MSTETLIEWDIPEYKHKKRTIDWFWGLGVVVIIGAIASVLLHNTFFAIFIIIAGGLLWHFAVTEPVVLHIKIQGVIPGSGKIAVCKFAALFL